jgi:OmpA-OmpF porin, OOP family
MATSLLEGLQELMTPGLLSTAARTLAESEGSVSTGLAMSTTSMLVALAGKAEDAQAIRPFFDLFSSPANDGSVMRDPRLAAGAPPNSVLGAAANTLVSNLFGSQQSSVRGLITELSGLRSSSGASLLSMGGSLVLGLLGSRVRLGSLNLAGLSSLLLSERNQIMKAAPAGLGPTLGLSDIDRDADVGAAALRVSTPELERAGRSLLWPTLAALAVIAVLWVLAP